MARPLRSSRAARVAANFSILPVLRADSAGATAFRTPWEREFAIHRGTVMLRRIHWLVLLLAAGASASGCCCCCCNGPFQRLMHGPQVCDDYRGGGSYYCGCGCGETYYGDWKSSPPALRAVRPLRQLGRPGVPPAVLRIAAAHRQHHANRRRGERAAERPYAGRRDVWSADDGPAAASLRRPAANRTRAAAHHGGIRENSVRCSERA